MKTVVIAILASLLAGCAMFDENKAARDYSIVGDATGSNPGIIFTTADVRFVMRRRNPINHKMVTCTEPSPDVAAALSTATQLALQGGNKAANGQIGLTNGSAEAITELAGRTTALLALRDGLYRTCEAYANGVLGAEAYALVLARYGQLMTTLFLGQDIASAAGGAPQGAPGSPAAATSPPLVSVAMQGTGGTPTGNSPPAGPPTANQPPPASQNNTPQASPNANSPASDPNPSAAGANTPIPPSPPANSSPGTQNASPQGPGNGNSGNSSNPNPAGGAQSPPPSPPSGTAIAAASLARMNEDYFDLDRNPIQLLTVACINEYDPTDFSAKKPDPWLKKTCRDLKGWKRIADAERGAASIELLVKHPAPAVDLSQVGLTQLKPDSGTSPAMSTAPTPRTTTANRTEQIRLVQVVLRAQGYRIRGVTGLLDQHTINAMQHYERNNALPVSRSLTSTLLQHIAGDAQSALSAVAQ
jgi:hypothetical protein